MNIGKPFDADGKEMSEADIAYTSAAIRWAVQGVMFKFVSLTSIYSHPPAFQCRVEPRSTAAYEMLERRAIALSAEIEDTGR
jgi:membrane protein implicated in regulation of membrane protease activity